MKKRKFIALLCSLAILLSGLVFSGFASHAEPLEADPSAPYLLPLKTTPEKTSHGVTYTHRDGYYRVCGRPEQSSYLSLYGSKTAIPAEFRQGVRLNIRFSSGSKQIRLGIRAFGPDHPNGVWLMTTTENTTYTFPDLSPYTGVQVRIAVAQSPWWLNRFLYPVIEVADTPLNLLPANNGLTKRSHGITFTARQGTYTLQGTATASTYLTLCGSKTTFPTLLESGRRLKIGFASGTNYVTLGIRAFSAARPNGVWLMKTATDTAFTVPDLSPYTGAELRLTVTRRDAPFDLTLRPVIETTKPKAYLTIIDDDGDKHFKTDIMPLIRELKVPISTAVTPSRIGSKPRWMSWTDIMQCQLFGAEVLCHTYHHYSGEQVAQMPGDRLLQDYIMARNEMRRRGIKSGEFLVYSSSTGNNPMAQNYASQLFKCGIKIGGSALNNSGTDPYALSRYRLDYAATESRQDWNPADLQSYVDQVAAEGGWQIWMFHTSNALWRQRVVLDANGNVARDQNGAPIPMVDGAGNPVLDEEGRTPTMGTVLYRPLLREAILYARANGVEIITVQKGYDLFYQN